ncbi:MAG: VTT domain-containing protein [Bacteroidales bacterium]|nr:VTT domain-containing protein [Bacteroidales bacterium]
MGNLSLDIITIFLVGITGMWKAIPLGFFLEVSPFYIFLMTSLGSILGILILFFFGNKIRSFILNRRLKKGKSKKEERVLKLFDRYGLIGLGIFGTLIIGPPMTMILGLALVQKQKHFLYWTMTGIVVWSLVLTILGSLGIEFITRFV